jgi:hypothetical protein
VHGWCSQCVVLDNVKEGVLGRDLHARESKSTMRFPSASCRRISPRPRRACVFDTARNRTVGHVAGRLSPLGEPVPAFGRRYPPSSYICRHVRVRRRVREKSARLDGHAPPSQRAAQRCAEHACDGARCALQLGLIRDARRLVLARLEHPLDGGVHVRHQAGRPAAGNEQILMSRGQIRDSIGRRRDVRGRPPAP